MSREQRTGTGRRAKGAIIKMFAPTAPLAACAPQAKKAFVYDKTQPADLMLLVERIYFPRDPDLDLPFNLPDDYAYWVLIMHRDLLTRRGCPSRFVYYDGDSAAGLKAA